MILKARTIRDPRYAQAARRGYRSVIGAPGTTLSALKAVGELFHAQALKERTEARGERMT